MINDFKKYGVFLLVHVDKHSLDVDVNSQMYSSGRRLNNIIEDIFKRNN
jgi:hypothetical protein